MPWLFTNCLSLRTSQAQSFFLTKVHNWIRTLVHNMEREEDISPQRKPINDEIHAELIKQAKKEGFASLEAIVTDAASDGEKIWLEIK